MKAGLLWALWLVSSLAYALAPGERLAPWTLLDQFEQPFTLGEDARVLLVAKSMDAAKLLDAALQGKPRGYLEARHAVFLADISRMPKPIASLFALPKMRDYHYRVLLDREARVTSRYPVEEGAVLWLALRDGRLIEQRNFTDAAALAQALEEAGR